VMFSGLAKIFSMFQVTPFFDLSLVSMMLS